MSEHSLSKFAPLLLVGAGPASPNLVTKSFPYAEKIIAVDGGLKTIRAAGLQADAVIGDFDSVDHDLNTPRLHRPDQNFTDFEKALCEVDAPVILGVGFLGGRLDHQMAAFSALLKDPRPIILVDDDIICFLAPRHIRLNIPAGSPVALYPLRPCQVTATGLLYPLKDADMAPDGLISTSNHMIEDVLDLQTQGRGILTILPAAVVGDVIATFLVQS